jgi:solute carrier family 24 (sodium/potassium/calcium exchanger), member 6
MIPQHMPYRSSLRHVPTMAARQSRKYVRSSRPFIISTLIVTVLVGLSCFRNPLWSTQSSQLQLLTRASSLECRDIHRATDQCAFARSECDDDEAGLLPYIAFYYCTLGSAKPVAFAILTIWLGLLFTTIGIAASDFFSVNLSTIARILGLSESLAGVTFLALGNGSPDVFSTFAAMDSNSGSMAIGELIGAASFITAVVAGSMALVREFRVSRRTFVRDICFFIAAVSFTMMFLADGRLQLWECAIMIGFYVFYVVTVVGWHWASTRRRRRQQKEAASRSQFDGLATQDADTLEPYHDEGDDEYDEAPRMNIRTTRALDPGDISALESGPRIEVQSPGDDLPPDDDEDDRGIHVAAEMTSSMRVLRPQGRRSTTTITPIRPSLVGALEFRSILTSLQKEGNMRLAPISSRAHSSDRIPTRAAYATQSTSNVPTAVDTPAGHRDRALSSGDLPLGLDGPAAGDLAVEGMGRPAFRNSAGSSLSADGRLAPPGHGAAGSLGSSLSARLPVLQIPATGSAANELQFEAPVPFPEFSDSPMPITPTSPQRTSSFPMSSTGVVSRTSFPFPAEPPAPRPIRWWPYRILPPPHVLLATLFPTLQGWREKPIWDKMVSVISVPSIFLLVITLPVVDSEDQANDDAADSEADTVILPSPAHNGHAGALQGPAAQHEAETEWQRYRRNTRTNGSRPSLQTSPARTPSSPLPEGQDLASRSVDDIADAIQIAKPAPEVLMGSSETATLSKDDSLGWSRWLVALQMFTGPLFTVFIVWANMVEDLDNPGATLLRLVLYSLLASCVLLSVLLLTTSPDKKPKYHFLLCFLGFIISVAWISTVAGEVVGVLKAIGVIFDISEAILGLTIFAVGNSLGDLVADVTVARLGYPVMALYVHNPLIPCVSLVSLRAHD